jgi:hypothetical protein
MEGGGRAPGMMLTIRWQTSLPVRQALVRAKFGNEAGTSPEAAKFLAQTPENYIISITGIPPQMLRGNPEQLKQAIQLKVKDKPVINPVNLQAADAQSPLYVIFPRKQEGKDLIQLEDNEVELQVKLGRMDVKRKFKLKDMVFDGKLEL